MYLRSIFFAYIPNSIDLSVVRYYIKLFLSGSRKIHCVVIRTDRIESVKIKIFLFATTNEVQCNSGTEF